MEVLVGLILLVLLLASAYWYATLKFDYWKKRGVPYIPGKIIVGSQWEFFRTVIQELEMKRYKKYGRIHGFFEASRPCLTVADPDVLRNILVKDFQVFPNRRVISIGEPVFDKMVSILTGEKWKQVRTLITPAFTTGKIKKMTSIILDSAKSLAHSLENSIQSNEPMDAKKTFGAFTMDVIANCAFATKVDSHQDPDNPFVQNARKVFSQNISWRAVLFFLAPSMLKTLKISVLPPGVLEFFKDVVVQIIEERKRTGQTRNDFLQLLMEAADEVKSNSPVEVEEDEKIPDTKLSNFSHVDMVAQCVLFFLAGYDSTASTLSFASYELALNPECQDRLIKEIDTIVAKYDGELTYDAVQEMKYMDMVISETLRKHPPGIRLERTAEEDYKMEGHDIVIPKGVIVGIPVYAMHHDPEFYPEPEKFDPERFTAEAKAARHPYTYLPFGNGPRNCLGMRFAMMEIKICLAHLFSRFRLQRCAQTKVPLEYYFGQGLLQPKGIFLSVQPREK